MPGKPRVYVNYGLTLAASIVALGVAAPASAVWTAGVFAGGCRTEDTSLTLALPAVDTSVTFDPVHYRSSASFEMPIYYASGEYKLTRTVQDVTIAGGSARTPLVTHHLVAGVTFHLGFPH
jgi:hypothetical protein